MHNKKHIKIFIIAGEVSGDVLGAKIMHALNDISGGVTLSQSRQEIEFVGIGGENMQAAGLKTLFPISDLAVMGLIEVIAKAKTLTGRINQTANAIIAAKPDIVLTVDAPSFAKRVIKKVKNSTIHTPHFTLFYHVVAPQVWAWGAKRAEKFAKIFDRLYAFFDFEVPYFTKYGLETIAVGHPIADGLKPISRQSSVVSHQKNIALIPGSRMSEVKKLLPLMRASAEQISCHMSHVTFYIPVVETTRDYIAAQTADWRIKPELVPSSERYKLYEKTDVAIAASGTVSAELAIMHVPAVIVYKMNRLTMLLARMVIKIKWASLVNILLNKTVYPELLGDDANCENVVRAVTKLFDPVTRDKMISELSAADKMWRRGESASKLIAKDIIESM